MESASSEVVDRSEANKDFLAVIIDRRYRNIYIDVVVFRFQFHVPASGLEPP